MRNAGLDEAQAGIKIAGRNINNLRYADDSTLMAESEEVLKSLLMKVKKESEKVGLKLNIQKTKIMASGLIGSVQFSSVAQLCPTLFDPWTAASQASLSITNSQSSPKPVSIELMMPSNHIILCRPLLLLPSIFPSIRVFSNESALRIRCPKYHFMANRWGDSGNSDILHFLVSKITADGDCSHEIKRRLLLGRRVMANLDSIFKSRDITLPTKVCLVKAMFFPVVMYGYESWTIKKTEQWRIDAFELWCWRRLLRVLWTARRPNQSILKDISPEYSLEGLMLKLKLQYFGHLMWRTDWFEKTLNAAKDWRQEEKRTTEDEMVGWHHWLDGREFE